MEGIILDVKFDPERFKAFARNEGYMIITISGKPDSPYLLVRV